MDDISNEVLALDSLLRKAEQKAQRLRRKEALAKCRRLAAECRAAAPEVKAVSYEAGQSLYEAAEWLDMAASMTARKKPGMVWHKAAGITRKAREVSR